MTKIEWTDDVWNPTRGCSRVSEGCRHCYAERMASRFAGPGQPYEGLVRGGKWNGVVRFVPDKLGEPLTWRKPRRVFVNSMSDLFHDAMSNEEIAAVFGVMAATPRHTYQVLTKRPARMVEWFKWAESHRARCAVPGCEDEVVRGVLDDAARSYPGIAKAIGIKWCGSIWPLRNVWLGVSVEDQAAADERIPPLLRTPAAVRFLSCEPLLGQVDLTRIGEYRGDPLSSLEEIVGRVERPALSWVIAGCESGFGARPCDVAWLRSLRDQCAAALVPFFLKQAKGSPQTYGTGGVRLRSFEDVTEGTGSTRKAGGIIGAPYLDGKQHLEFPEVP